MTRYFLVSLGLHLGALALAVLVIAAPGGRPGPPPLTVRISVSRESSGPVPGRVPVRPAARALSGPAVPENRPSEPVPEAVAPPVSPDGDQGTGSAGAAPVVDALTPGPSTQEPELLSYPSPEYPREARKRGWEGVVGVAVTLGADGTASGFTVVRPSSWAVLDQAAVEALRKARFRAGSREGVAVPGILEVTIRFNLQ